MKAGFIVLAGIFGAAFGSFLTVVVHRVPRGESVAAPRSRCPSCGTQLRAVDNVPVLSWVLLRGKCRACGAPISVRYPLLELATAGLFVGAAWRFGPGFTAIMIAAFFLVLLAVSAIDLERKIIPNRIIYPSLIVFAVLVAAGWAAGAHLHPVGSIVGMLAFGGAMFVVAFISPGGMGVGDAKLAALIGLVLGSLGLSYVTVAAALAILVGGLVAIAAVLFLRANRKTAVPFGPSLAAGAVLAAFVAPRVASWYGGLLGR
jgi:leader peptidase (prepilin peptidase)/N-methyltransferase